MRQDKLILRVDYRPIGDLRPSASNPRTHTSRQIEQIAASIREFGFINPVLVDEADAVIAGHGRLAAARLLGLGKVPAIRLCSLTEVQKRGLALADNKLADNAGWNEEILARELEFLSKVEIDFDLSLTGFEAAEIDVLIDSLSADAKDSAADTIPEADASSPPVSELGDLWLLGPHRLLCGDAREPKAFERLMDGQKAQMVFVDPPYNLSIEDDICGLGAVGHPNFMMASGEMTEGQFSAFLQTVFGNLAANSVHASIHFVFMDWRHIRELLAAGGAVYKELKNLCIWVKNNGGMGSFYRSQHELVFVFKNGSGRHVNNIQLGAHGRYRTNVWVYAGVNTLREGRLDELSMHPTVKPVALVADAIKDCSTRRGIVLDCFAGSGTILIAAELTGRHARAMEIDPRYVDVAVRRWQTQTGDEAKHARSGLTFAQTAKTRAHQGRSDVRRAARIRRRSPVTVVTVAS